MTEPDSRDRRRAIGVLLARRGEDPQNSTVTAEVAWGVTPFLVPRVTAGSEKEAISVLRTGLRNHRHRPLLLFDDLEEAEQERRRNMLATMLLSGAYAPNSRDKLAQAVGGLPHSEQVLRAFDEIAHALYDVEAGNHASRYLAPVFDCDATAEDADETSNPDA